MATPKYAYFLEKYTCWRPWTTKLSLSAQTDVIRQAKRLAKRHRTSVSAMFERMVRAMAESSPGRKPIGPLTRPLTRKATGIIAIRGGKTEREILEDALAEKYGAKP